MLGIRDDVARLGLGEARNGGSDTGPAPEVRGRLMPNWEKTYMTNPEQSQPLGVVPPDT